MTILKLPKLVTDEECKRLLAWIDSLEIQEVQELEKIYNEPLNTGNELLSTFEEAIEDLEFYAQGRRDQSFEGWEKQWREMEIKNESDYEFYPNHVSKDTISRYRHVLEKLKSGFQPEEKK